MWKRLAPLTAAQSFGLWLVLLPAIIDHRFKVVTAGSLALYAVLVLASLAGATSLFIRGGAGKSSIDRYIAIALVFWLQVCGVGFLRGQPIADVVRASPPLFLFSVGLVGVRALAVSGADARAVWRQVLIAAALAVVVKLAMAFTLDHVDLSTVRYEVLSGAAPLISGYMIATLIFGGVTLGGLALIMLHVGVIALSVTRTQIVVGAVPAVAAIFSAWGRLYALRGLGQRVIVVGSITLAAIAIAAFLPGAPLERWAQRLFEAQASTRGLDVTALARAGEAKFQIGRLASSASGLLFGFGIAAPTAFDASTAKLVEALIGSNNGYFTESGIGHNNYLGVIFVGGILSGGAFLWAQLVGLIRAMTVIRALASPALYPRFGGMIAVPLAYFGYLAFGLLGATNGGRSTSLLMGLTLGMVLWIYDAIHEPSHVVS